MLQNILAGYFVKEQLRIDFQNNSYVLQHFLYLHLKVDWEKVKWSKLVTEWMVQVVQRDPASLTVRDCLFIFCL